MPKPPTKKFIIGVCDSLVKSLWFLTWTTRDFGQHGPSPTLNTSKAFLPTSGHEHIISYSECRGPLSRQNDIHEITRGGRLLNRDPILGFFDVGKSNPTADCNKRVVLICCGDINGTSSALHVVNYKNETGDLLINFPIK